MYTYSSSVVRPAGIAYFGDHNGRLNVVDAATGALLHAGHGADPAAGRSHSPNGVGFWTGDWSAGVMRVLVAKGIG